MDLLIQTLTAGIAFGLIYALMATGLTVIFGVMDIPNFAHGELYILGPFFIAAAWEAGAPFLIACIIGLAAVGVIAALLYVGLLYPLRSQGLVPVVLVTVGVSIILQHSVLNIWGSEPMRLPSPIPDVQLSMGPLSLNSTTLLVSAIAVTLLLCVDRFVNKSRMGAAARAVFQDAPAAALVGINTRRVYVATFVVGALLAAGGGALNALQYPVYPTIAGLVVAKAFVVVIVGGLGDFRGAILAGVMLGLGEALVSTYLHTEMRDMLAYALVIVVLLMRPEGLFRRTAWAT